MGGWETRKGFINNPILPPLLLNIYLVNKMNNHVLCEGIAGMQAERQGVNCGDLHAVALFHQQRAVWR